MAADRALWKRFAWIGVVFVQLVMIQVITFLASFLVGDIEEFPKAQPLVFSLLLGFSFSTGVLLGGWLGLRWLPGKPRLGQRWLGSLAGALLPFVLVPVLPDALQPDSPLFLAAMLCSIAGFAIAGMDLPNSKRAVGGT